MKQAVPLSFVIPGTCWKGGRLFFSFAVANLRALRCCMQCTIARACNRRFLLLWKCSHVTFNAHYVSRRIGFAISKTTCMAMRLGQA
jgi:hypothetical protein